MMHDTADNAVGLHLPELLDQHLLRDRRDRPFEIGEAQHLAAEQVKQDHQFPAPFEDAQHILNAACRG